MLQNFVKHGQQWALLFEQPLLDELHIDPTLPVEVTTAENTVTIKPTQPPTRAAMLQAVRESIYTEYSEAFKKTG